MISLLSITYIMGSWLVIPVAITFTLCAPFWFAVQDEVGPIERLIFITCMTSLIWSWFWPLIILAVFCFGLYFAVRRFFSDEGILEEEGYGYEHE
jgi:hypothetical protein